MAIEALGMIETVGLVTATECADAAVKAADVQLVGYELTKGQGLVLVKILGEVGAVRAAIDAARASGAKVGKVFSSSIIPRPADDTDIIIHSKLTVGYSPEK